MCFLPPGPAAQTAKDQAAKTSSEFSNLANARQTPAQPAATGQPLTHYHSFFFELLSWNNPSEYTNQASSSCSMRATQRLEQAF